MRGTIVWLMMLMLIPVASRAETLWSTGTPNGDYREFAIPGHFAEYSQHFPHDVTYTIGRSRASTDWPYVHPGPSDPWAGSRLHPFHIDFHLRAAPTTPCKLNVYLIDSRHDSPQVMEIDVNGLKHWRFALVSGTGDVSLTNPNAGMQDTVAVPFPAGLLKPGYNRITLTVVASCWALYDAVSLETGANLPAGPVIRDLVAAPGTGLVHISLFNSGAEGTVSVGLKNGQARTTLVSPGRNRFDLPSREELSPGAMVVVTAANHRWEAPVQLQRSLWRIGEADGSWQEFAIAGKYADYQARFPNDVDFQIGKSDPGRDWPFIHPGPNDAWAGTRRHPFRVDFDVASVPTGVCRLDLNLVDTQHLGGPRLEVRVNDSKPTLIDLPKGATDDSLIDSSKGRHSQASVAFPGSLLHAGRNRVIVTIVSGSWIQYDSLELVTGADLPEAPQVEGLQVAYVPLFRWEGGRLMQAVRVTARNTGALGEGIVHLFGPATAGKKMGLAPGTNSTLLLVPALVRPGILTVTLQTGDREHSARCSAVPQRHWKIYVGPSTHTDIGYTDLQERVFQRHNENTAAAIAASAKDPTFRWNLEVGFQAELYAKQGPQAAEALGKRLRSGQIGLGGLYLNLLTGLCSGEELAQAVGRIQRIALTNKCVADEANLTDVPTAVGTLPMLLRQGGVPYFADGVDDALPFVWGGPQVHQSPYWWEGLDGSRVLAISAVVYAQASILGLTDSVEMMEDRLPDWMADIGRPGYPGDALYVYGSSPDNQPIQPIYTDVARQWNKRWAFPHIIIGRADEFFKYVESNFGKTLPVVRGDIGSLWEDGAASSATETALNRYARTHLTGAVQRLAVGSAAGTGAFPRKAVDDAWSNVLFFDEHTWGAASSISEPEGEQTVRQWATKAAFAQNAAIEAESLQVASRRSAAAKTITGSPKRILRVFNDLSWPRDIVVTADHTNAGAEVREATPSSAEVPCQVNDGRVVFTAKQIPPLGWRDYLVSSAPEQQARGLLQPGSDPWTWECPKYQIRIDSVTGSIAGLVDHATGREWVNRSNGHGLNEFLYVLGSDGNRTVDPRLPMQALQIQRHTAAHVSLVENGGQRAVLHIGRSGPQAPPVDTYVIIGRGTTIELVNVIHKRATLVKEAGYFAFPFQIDRAARPRAFVDLPYGVLNVAADQVPGACTDWLAVNSFAAITDGNNTAYLATPHAPLIMYNDIFRLLLHPRATPLNGAIYSYVFNNYWGTNYKASQGGDLLFSYTLHLELGDFDPVKASHFGWDRLAEMQDPRAGTAAEPWVRLLPGSDVSVHEGSPIGACVHLSEGPVVLGGLTHEDGRLLARLYNPTRQAALAVLSLPGLTIRDARRTDLIGRPISGAVPRVIGNYVSISVPARGIATVALRTEKR